MRTFNLSTANIAESINALTNQVGTYNVIFDDGETAAIPVRKLIFHLIFFEVARKWGVLITPDFIVNTDNVNADTISKLGTKILNAVRIIHPVYHDVTYDFNDAINKLNRFVIDNCQEYHKSLSILDLARISTIPEITKITENRISDPNIPLKEAERRIRQNFGRLFEELNKPHPFNTLRDFINLRFVNETQLAHIFYQVGFRTDIDDTMIRYPVQGNYLDGLKNVSEYCLEALSAKKSAFYNRDSLPTTEYFGRKQHILLSEIRYLYPGDCGTNVTMPMMITSRLKNVVMYKNVVEGAKLVTLTPENIDNYVNKLVQFRTPMACRHRNGVCEACAGKLLGSLTPRTHIGIFSAIQTTSVVTQTILGAKHMQNTSTVEYAIPSDLTDFFEKHKGSIYVKLKLAEKFKNTSIVFNINDVKHLLGLADFNIGGKNAINEESFGNCREILILRDNNPITDKVKLEYNNQAPRYSKALIKYIAEYQDNVIIKDEMMIISMKDFDFKHPLFRLRVMNNSMVKFVEFAKKLMESKIKDYTSATELVNDFTELIYQQVKPNMAYLEVVLRAAMITDKYDYRLPIITDIDNVKFTTNLNANMMRSLGNLCAFERLHIAFINPDTYLIPKTFGQFDEFLNLKPKNERRIGDRRNQEVIPIR